MYFEAEANGFKYEFNVRELRRCWHVDIRKENDPWRRHVVDKDDYQSIDGAISFIYNNSSYLVDVVEEGTEFVVYTRGVFRSVCVYNDQSLLHESLKSGDNLSGGNDLNTGMPGKIIDVMVKVGDEVEEGVALLIMEAMKMENEIRAPRNVKVKEIHVEKGDNVEGGSLLISFEPDFKPE